VAIRQRIKAGGETFGMRVARLRQKSGGSKSDLAKAVGVYVTCIWNWEEGNTNPRAPALHRLADALETTPEYLTTGKAVISEPRVGSGEGEMTSGEQGQKSLADLIFQARETIAAVAGLPSSRVRIVLDYGE
jgi:transcriptional regulator with XRE-family HTH domain